MTWRKNIGAIILGLCVTSAPVFAEDVFTVSGSTVTLAVTGTTARVQFATQSPRSLRIYNAGTVAAFIQCGADNTVVATVATGIPIAPGSVELIGCPGLWVAAITSSGTATMYFTPGSGI